MITIFTPTFNRKEQLAKLYSSLKEQIDNRFIWLIVDDGSTDGTREYIANLQNIEKSFRIDYVYQQNQGKHIAYNTALDRMGEKGYHVTVDSDDFLDSKAIQLFNQEIRKLESEKNYVGVVFPKTPLTGAKRWLVQDIDRVNIPDILLRYRLSIETCILIKNEASASFRFPQFDNEKFLSEEILYIYLATRGYFRPVDADVYYFSYLQEGLTRNTFKLWIHNFYGSIYFLEQREKYILDHFKSIIRYREYIKVQLNKDALFLKSKGIKKSITSGQISYLLLPFSLIWKYIRFRGV